MLGERPTYGINGSFSKNLQQKFSINFSKERTKFYNCDNSYLFINREEIYKYKSDNKNAKFLTQLCLGSISKKFNAFESREVSFKENVYDFFNSLQFY